MRVVWLGGANAAREAQLDYVFERNPRAAIALGDSVDAAAEHLGAHPLLGRVGRVENTREFVVPSTPYILVYRGEAEAVVILRMLHHAQRWPPVP